jgi:23S rRNA (cytosine1962-C5)-methyltransferase
MRIVLKQGRDFAVRSGHPWIFSGAIDRVDDPETPGGVGAVHGADGRLLGCGSWNPKTSIAVRMLTRGEEAVDAALVRRRLETALRWRRALRGSDAWRLVNGEGDQLPGVVVDRYGDFLVTQFLTAGAEHLKPWIVEGLVALCAPRGIFERSEGNVRRAEGLGASTGVLAGEEPPPDVVIEESGRRYRVDVRTGQKTGFFLDQRPNRDLVTTIAADRRVLNLFAYTGAFAIAAAQGGAAHVTSVESSVAALAHAEESWVLNGHAPERASFVRADVFTYLRGELPASDLVIVDPPPFARRRADRDRALAGYKDVNLHALRHTAPDALLMTFSCSQHVDADAFHGAVAAAAADAGRECQLLARLGPGLDHPQALAHTEGRYLKGLLLRVTGILAAPPGQASGDTRHGSRR